MNHKRKANIINDSIRPQYHPRQFPRCLESRIAVLPTMHNRFYRHSTAQQQISLLISSGTVRVMAKRENLLPTICTTYFLILFSKRAILMHKLPTERRQSVYYEFFFITFLIILISFLSVFRTFCRDFV